MRKSLMWFSVGLLCCVAMFPKVGSAHLGMKFLNMKDMGASPTFGVDYERSLNGIIKGVMNLCNDGEQKAQLIMLQEGINQNADGTAGSEPNSVSTSGTALSGGVYDYVKQQVWKQPNPYHYDILEKALSASFGQEQAKKAVEKTFFTPVGSKTTDKEKISAQRQKYAEITSNFHIILGNGIHQSIVKDLAVAGSAPVPGSNEVSALAADAQTLDEMIKTTLADLTLQIELLEEDAMQFMLRQPVELLVNPEEGKK